MPRTNWLSTTLQFLDHVTIMMADLDKQCLVGCTPAALQGSDAEEFELFTGRQAALNIVHVVWLV